MIAALDGCVCVNMHDAAALDHQHSGGAVRASWSENLQPEMK